MSARKLALAKHRARPTEQRQSKSCREDGAYTSMQATRRIQATRWIQATVHKQSESSRHQRSPPAPSMTHAGCHEEVNICTQLTHGGMRSSLSYLPTLWWRTASGGTSEASVVPDGKVWHFHRHLQAATDTVCTCSPPQAMLPADEMFKREKGDGHAAPIGFSFLSVSLNSHPRQAPCRIRYPRSDQCR